MMNSNGIVRKIRLGDDVSTYCGRCKEDRLHQVVALSGLSTPERVICQTCRSEHRFRSKAVVTRKTSTRKPGTGSRRVAVDDIVPTNIRDYSTKETYQTGSFISHPKFGLGRVVESRIGKIDVKFGSDLRTLLHAG